MTGPSPGGLLGTCALVLIPSIVFNALVVPDVASKYSLAFTIVGAAWPLWCLGNLVAAGTTDPGIVRREPYRPPTEGRARARYREEVLPNGRSVTVKWNDTCNIYQPPRAHHCSVNDDCIDKFDHHCPWVGTTIGRRNYRPFLGFVFGTAILCVFVIATCALQIKIKYDDLPNDTQSRNLKAIGKAPFAMVVLFLAFLGFCFVGVLSCFHAYLVATNQTTYENFRDGYSWDENPHNKGLVGNCLEAWCSKKPPSRFRLRRSAREQPHLDGVIEEEAKVEIVVDGEEGAAPAEPPRRHRMFGSGEGGGGAAAGDASGQQTQTPRHVVDPSIEDEQRRRAEIAEARAEKRRIETELAENDAKMRDLTVRIQAEDSKEDDDDEDGGGGEVKEVRPEEVKEETEDEDGGTPASPGGYEGEGESNSRVRKYENRL